MSVKEIYSDDKLIELLHQDKEDAVEVLFQIYYKDLCMVVYRMLYDKDLAEDIVQEVFFTIWKNRKKIDINTSIRAYLKRATVNRTLNYIRDNKKKTAARLDDAPIKDWRANQYDGQQSLEYDELNQKVEDGINMLPPRCRLVFVMSRYEQFSHREIAEQLDISEKTVENQIGKALKILRNHLQQYL